MKPSDIALAVVVMAIWGLNFVAVKVGEPLSVQKIAGGAVTIVGVALVVLRPMRDKPVPTS